MRRPVEAVRQGVGSRVRSRRLVRLMQAIVAAVLVLGALRRNVAVIVNAAGVLAVTFLPALLERDYRITLDPGLTLWVTAAVSLHAVGMLGPYTAVWWWDQVTHTLSATVVAGVGYVTARAIDVHSESVHLPPRFMFVYVLLFTLAVGVLWEVFEFVARGIAVRLGREPVLVQFSLEDTVLDLVFDLVGAVVVALFGTRRLSAVVAAIGSRLAGAD